MAGYTDRPFRRLARRFGAALVVTEMVSARGLLEDPEKSLKLMEFGEEERPVAVQLFGGDPSVLGEAAALTVKSVKPDLLDVNFGCPVAKVLKGSAGAALLKDPKRAGLIVRAMVGSSGGVPVMVKTRAGFDDFDGSFHEVLQAVTEAGACAFTLHARTRRQMYQGRARWESIAEAKRASRIPVIGNGDVKTPADAGRMMRETGCDAVMVGRACAGAPWVFAAMNAYLETGKVPHPLPLKERLGTALGHYEDALKTLGSRLGLLEMRKHLTHYIKGFDGARDLRQALLVTADPDRVRRRLIEYIAALEG
jgi:nifR3 family TIM-barrel protein